MRGLVRVSQPRIWVGKHHAYTEKALDEAEQRSAASGGQEQWTGRGWQGHISDKTVHGITAWASRGEEEEGKGGMQT